MQFATPPRPAMSRRRSTFLYEQGDLTEYDTHKYEGSLYEGSQLSVPLQNTDSRREQRSRRQRRRHWRRVPYFAGFVSAVQIIVFIVELVKMGVATGSPFQTQPAFNPMLGPSSYLLINMGARFTPCMTPLKSIEAHPNAVFPCPNSTSLDTNVCSIGELCGFNYQSNKYQSWRLVTAMFLHSGFVHIIFNLLLQIKLGFDLEYELGRLRFAIIYLLSGIGGFILSATYAFEATASTGASGALFGLIATDLLDLLYNWKLYTSPWRNLVLHTFCILISFCLGLLPGIDNFAHIGGFIVGLLSAAVLIASPLKLRLDPTARDQNLRSRVMRFELRNAPAFFTGHTRLWYLFWVVRAAALALLVIYFVLVGLAMGNSSCSWCKYLSCLPVHGWCDQGGLFGS